MGIINVKDLPESLMVVPYRVHSSALQLPALPLCQVTYAKWSFAALEMAQHNALTAACDQIAKYSSQFRTDAPIAPSSFQPIPFPFSRN